MEVLMYKLMPPKEYLVIAVKSSPKTSPVTPVRLFEPPLILMTIG